MVQVDAPRSLGGERTEWRQWPPPDRLTCQCSPFGQKLCSPISSWHLCFGTNSRDPCGVWWGESGMDMKPGRPPLSQVPLSQGRSGVWECRAEGSTLPPLSSIPPPAWVLPGYKGQRSGPWEAQGLTPGAGGQRCRLFFSLSFVLRTPQGGGGPSG